MFPTTAATMEKKLGLGSLTGFDFHSPTRVVFGAGSLARLGELARELGDTRVLLVTDRSAPWQLDTLVPADAVGSVRYFARAVDDAGQSRDSAVVTVLVQ